MTGVLWMVSIEPYCIHHTEQLLLAWLQHWIFFMHLITAVHREAKRPWREEQEKNKNHL